MSESQAKCRMLEESLRAFSNENENADSDIVQPKHSGHSPTSSLGGELVVVNGSSSNSIESDSSDFDEYFDTG